MQIHHWDFVVFWILVSIQTIHLVGGFNPSENISQLGRKEVMFQTTNQSIWFYPTFWGWFVSPKKTVPHQLPWPPLRWLWPDGLSRSMWKHWKGHKKECTCLPCTLILKIDAYNKMYMYMYIIENVLFQSYININMFIRCIYIYTECVYIYIYILKLNE